MNKNILIINFLFVVLFCSIGCTHDSADNIKKKPYPGNIAKPRPSLTISSEHDTIKLGEIYSAKIRVNFPLLNCDCKIYVRTDSTKKDGTIYHKIGTCPEAQYFTPTIKLGENVLEVSMLQLKYSTIKKDSLLDEFKIISKAKYWVIK